MQPLPPGTVSAADWVRVRREFPDATLFSNVQYSFSVDAKNMVETLVLRVRDPKPDGLMEISIEDSASAVASAAAMLSSTTPVSRVRLERFGKSSVALARCAGEEGNPAPDQTRLRADLSRRLFDYGALSRRSGRAQIGAARTGPPKRGNAGWNCGQGGRGQQEERIIPSSGGTGVSPVQPGGDARRSTSALKRSLFFGI